MFSINRKHLPKFYSDIDQIGTFTNKDVFEYFNFTPPMITNNEQNSSTDAVADGFQDERFDEDMDIDIGNEMKIEGYRQEPQKSLNDAFIETDNQVPPEYADDPDMWYAIQASLKVRFLSEYANIC